MRILKNDTADFSIEIKNLDNLYIAKVTESHIRFVYDGKRYILSKDDSDDEFMTLYKVVFLSRNDFLPESIKSNLLY